MTWNKSNLAKYGYDLVMATTQASINATMKEYLSALKEPEVAICYVADQQGNPTRIGYCELKRLAHGSDPFTTPDGANPATDQNVINLVAARFMVGFKARIGLPPGIPPREVPDIVILGDNTAAVSFNLMCAEFIVVQYILAGYGNPAAWMNKSQPSGHPWIFGSKVDIRLSTTERNAYNTLPPDVQKQIKNLGTDAFSVKQLLFDLDNATLQTMPTISGVDPSSHLYNVLQRYFQNIYIQNLKANGQPVLGAAILPGNSASFTTAPTDLNFEINPLLDTNGHPFRNPTKDQQKLTTLNYLLAVDGHTLPPASPFTWNWIEPNEAAEYHGVIAMKSDTFWDQLLNNLKGYNRQFCRLPWTYVKWNGSFYGVKWSLNEDPHPNFPENSKPGAPYHFKYEKEASASDQYGFSLKAWMIIRLTYVFDLTLDSSTNTISINQQLAVYVYAGSSYQHFEGNVLDKAIKTTYELRVSEDGKIVPNVTSKITRDAGVTPDRRYNDAYNVASAVSGFAQRMAKYSYHPPIAAFQSLIFPGGITFFFKKIGFSDSLDLVTHITYRDPR